MKSKQTRNAVVFSVLFSFNSSVAFAEQNASLFESNAFSSGSQYGLDLRSAKINGTSASTLGAHWASRYSGGLTVGFALQGLMTDVQAPPASGRGPMTLFYGGLLAEYEAYSYGMFNLFASTLLGFGQVGYRSVAPADTWNVASFRVIEPGVVATINLSPRSRLGLGMHYRWVLDSTVGPLARGDVNGMTYGLSVRTGIF